MKDYLINEEFHEYPLVKEVNISNIDSDEEVESDRIQASNDPSKHNFKIL